MLMITRDQLCECGRAGKADVAPTACDKRHLAQYRFHRLRRGRRCSHPPARVALSSKPNSAFLLRCDKVGKSFLQLASALFHRGVLKQHLLHVLDDNLRNLTTVLFNALWCVGRRSKSSLFERWEPSILFNEVLGNHTDAPRYRLANDYDCGLHVVLQHA